jgi:acylphosphatase
MVDDVVRLELRIRGRVQGVAFRWYAQNEARRLGLVGRVRNLPDGSVRLVAEGTRENLERLATWAVLGPDHARVDGCDRHWSDAAGQWTDFHIDG